MFSHKPKMANNFEQFFYSRYFFGKFGVTRYLYLVNSTFNYWSGDNLDVDLESNQDFLPYIASPRGLHKSKSKQKKKAELPNTDQFDEKDTGEYIGQNDMVVLGEGGFWGEKCEKKKEKIGSIG